ncbi:MAG: Gfo/Idh/MocA family oxidoreductase [Gemmatimonadales bacterium]|nr:Gfo/Idh/MocA family oxidoreductase [Gemmatimonadales bacterium]NIN13375.1 Gfo/Idh/MocA family oxidoreductase [Gemmatimonadales bacterium]NIN51378.1 Gfo/Idh/MocA family oxidoreductase [Gemmatimonadales bacterium]NIP08842.1 Gfo/Idh/MocA family oxidoreductase [Gemmatimonadales bacterium]NIQ99836.1 Gfo/Idh/MocA family oxidoreductase [Gemmatimonadales bacterium]
MKQVHLCIVGCGKIARLHSRVARTLRPRVQLSYASRSLQKAEQYRRRFGGVAAFGSYEEACSDPRTDAVLITTPHALHAEHARLAARHGKPLLIEKPVARNLAELKEIENAVAEAGVIAMVAENYFFKPLVRVLREHLDRGDIGAPLFIELNRTGRSKIGGWRADPVMMGGGALLEGGVHWINLLLQLGGDARQVLAVRPEQRYTLLAPFEDSLQVLVKFTDGAVGKLLHSWNLANRIGGLSISKIYGTEGNIHFETNGLFVLVLGHRRRLRLRGLPDIMGYRGMLKHFVACVRDGRPPAMSLAVARRDLALVAAAYRSLETGRFEPFTEDSPRA